MTAPEPGAVYLRLSIDRGSLRNYKAPFWVAEYLEEGGAKIRGIIDSLSAKQKQASSDRLQAAIDLDADTVPDSESFKAMAADVSLFGSGAFSKE
jgi:hypothetical protein